MFRSRQGADVVAGATVLVTGAARGMGQLYARRAADEGAAAIALWDLDAVAAERLATELGRGGIRVRAFGVDVSRQEDIAAAAERTRKEIGDPDILVNNAGIVRGKRFWQHDQEQDIEQTLRINALGPMWVTREFLPRMMADTARPRRILNIASAAGTMAIPNMSVYASSKWAVIGWSETLRLELEKDGYGHIAVTTFCPSYISTGMFAGARGMLMTPMMSPEQAVDRAWTAMRTGTPMVLTPWTVKLSQATRVLLPTRAWDVVADKLFRIYSSMDDFTGHSPKDRDAAAGSVAEGD